MPILGISNEMLIVLANNAAQQLELADHPIRIGDHLGKYIKAPGQQSVARQFAEDHHLEMVCESMNNKRYELRIIPLTGRLKGRGLIVTLTHEISVPEDQPQSAVESPAA